jgi:aminoglycoside phosphotransferase (APT) family kinase protein
VSTPDLGLDVDAVAAWLRVEIGFEGGLECVGRATAGSSNVTWFLRADDCDWVLRHPPPGPSLPSANDMAREWRYLSGLRGTGVPVPGVVASCEDLAVLGVPFLVVERSPGAPLHQFVPPVLRADPDARRALAFEAVDVLAALHRVDWRARGLVGSSTPYLQRQVRRWSDQLARASTASRLRGLDEITAWIVERMPAPSDEVIVHGDYGFHNLLVDSTRVTAVLDWELAAIGDPLADVANFLKSWGPDAPSVAGNPGNDALTALGAPSVNEMRARYAERTGRQLDEFGWYDAFVLWRSVVMLEGLYARHVAGTGVDPNGDRFETMVPAQLDALRRLVR